jgi:hypothetical protein
MLFLHLSGYKPPYQRLYEFRGIGQLIHSFDAFGCGIAVPGEIINHFAPADIVQQVLRIIARLKIPLLTLAVF